VQGVCSRDGQQRLDDLIAGLPPVLQRQKNQTLRCIRGLAMLCLGRGQPIWHDCLFSGLACRNQHLIMPP
jgi:hypothetical protein